MATQAENRLIRDTTFEDVPELRRAFMALRNRIPATIYTRWNDRVVRNGWHLNGQAGARSYLRRYGGNIGVLKLTHIARVAEENNRIEFAAEFWITAFSMMNPAVARQRAQAQRARVRRAAQVLGEAGGVAQAEREQQAVLNGILDQVEIAEQAAAPPPPTAEEFYNDLVEDQEFT